MQASSSSAAAAAAAAASPPHPPLESSFDNLDLLFCSGDEHSGLQADVGNPENEKGFDVEDSENNDGREGFRVYFPEISLSHALEVMCDV